MPGLRVKQGVAPAIFLSSLLLCSCGDDTKLPGPQNTTSTSGTSAGGGGNGGEAGNGGTAGNGASGGTGGDGGATASGGATSVGGNGGGGGGGFLCGNGTIDAGEACDGAELGTATCEGRGFTGGSLACSPTCALDTTGCTKPPVCGDSIKAESELCDDGNVAGGDGCSATCTLESAESEPNDTLAAADPLVPPWFAEIAPEGDVDFVQIVTPSLATLVVSTAGIGAGTCSDGSLDSFLTLFDAAGTILATNDDAQGGSSCSRVIAPNLPAGTYYARIEATSPVLPAAATFPYSLTVQSFTCGDGTHSLGEQCDDGNVLANDGCSPTCTLEADETEPNGTLATANVYTSPWVARIDPDGDIDIVSINVTAGAMITVKTTDPTGGQGCFTSVDTYVDILDPAGLVIATNDDAAGYCSLVNVAAPVTGKYHVQVQAPPVLGEQFVYVFPYALDITVQ